MPRFTASVDGIARCTVRLELRFTQTEWERLERAARLDHCPVRDLIDACVRADFRLWDYVEELELEAERGLL